MPVTMGMEHEGLKEAASLIHDLIRQAERMGIPAKRIVLGGFSQGGVLALQAGLTYEHELAGVAAFSSWLPGNLQNDIKQKALPIFMGQGGMDTTDPTKLEQQLKIGVAVLSHKKSNIQA